MACDHAETHLQQTSGYPGELYIAKAAENCGFLLVVPIISRTPTRLISPPYVNSGTTFYTKKRASDQFSEAPLIFSIFIHLFSIKHIFLLFIF